MPLYASGSVTEESYRQVRLVDVPVFLDTFTDDNDTALGSHTPDEGEQTWSQTASNSFKISNGKLVADRLTDGDMAVIDAGVECTLECDMATFNSGSNIGYACLVFWYVDSDNYYYISLNSNSDIALFYQVVGGSHNELIRWPYDLDSLQEVACRIDLNGAHMTLFIDGEELFSYTDPTTYHVRPTKVGVRFGRGGFPGPSTSATWDNFRISPYKGLRLNWPVYERYASNPVLELGGSEEWDDVDCNNPNVLWDAANNRWILYYSGYGADEPNIQHMGLAYADDPHGPWTKFEENPVMTANEEDDWGAFNGGLVWWNGLWHHYYCSSGASVIRHATSPDLINWTRHGIAIDKDNASWNSNGVFDAHARVLQDNSGIEVWYCGYDGTNRWIGRAVTYDGHNFIQDSDNPILDTPVWSATRALGEPAVWVPPGKEGQEYYLTHDACYRTNDDRRFIADAISIDGGKTWHRRILVLVGTSGWEAAQCIDSFPFKYAPERLHIMYGGVPSEGVALGIGIQIGIASAYFPYTTLRG